MAQVITKDNIKELAASGKPVVIDFWAEWCGPCRMLAPAVEELAADYEGRAVVGKCNIEENDTVAVEYSIRNIPTVLFLKDGQVVDRQVGLCAKSVLEEKLAKLL